MHHDNNKKASSHYSLYGKISFFISCIIWAIQKTSTFPWKYLKFQWIKKKRKEEKDGCLKLKSMQATIYQLKTGERSH